MYVLVVNAGSSSLKYQLMDTATNKVLAKGICERIGIDGLIEHKKEDGSKTVRNFPMRAEEFQKRFGFKGGDTWRVMATSLSHPRKNVLVLLEKQP